LRLKQVGVVVRAGSPARIEIGREYVDALDGVEAGNEYWVLYWMHRLTASDREVLRAHPRGDTGRPKQGVFSLRSPMRPNPIGLTRVKLLAREGSVLVVDGLDALEGSPVLDIKPL
jgi:tRNA-Thr(GGU) m(6)t(6)A37 methyltransferase TsaA